MTLPDYAVRELALPAIGSWPESRHRFSDAQVTALRAAEAANRPLLIRGEPGTGKSQLAHAAAVATRRMFLSVVVDHRTESTDLLWRYDAVARLADAHLAGVPGIDPKPDLSPTRYLSPGPLWWALNWRTASVQASQSVSKGIPEVPADWQWSPERGAVLLVDEIDKAEADVPNGLLEALGNGRFAVSPLGGVVERAADAPPPLIIITTNDERELPAPFLRRCLVLTLKLPSAREELISHMVDVGRLHFAAFDAVQPDALMAAAVMLVEDRERAERDGVYAPGLSEYLDLLRVLDRIGGDAVKQLAQLREYVFRKQPSGE